MIESHYEFVVTYEGKFYFSTSVRSCMLYDTRKAKDLYNELCKRFPESEGWNVEVESISCCGRNETLRFATDQF